MNDYAHQKMVQEVLKKKFGSHKRLVCKTQPKYPQQAEREYQRITNAYMRLLNQILKEHLPEIRDAANAERLTRTDAAASSKQQGKGKVKYDPHLTLTLTAVFDQMAAELERAVNGFGLYGKLQAMSRLTRKLTIREWKRAVKSTLGIDLMDDYYTGELYRSLMEQWVDENLALIKTIPQDTLGDMRKIVLDAYKSGTPTTTVVQQIQHAYSVTRRHAQLLARDQISKLNGQITKQQQKDAGVNEYMWSIVEDGHVRAGHAKLNHKRFSWDDPPVVDEKTGRRCHPGQDYQCRCSALAIFDFDTINLPIDGGGGAP